VNAGGPAGHGDVEAIVHEDACRAAACDVNQIAHDVPELSRFQIALPDLKIVDAGIDGMTRLLDEALPRRAAVRSSAGESMTIRDELKNQGSTRESACGSNRPPRLEKIGARSAMPTKRLMNPRPETPPRTNELLTNGLRMGQCCAK
jgi:hypothetical protein